MATGTGVNDPQISTIITSVISTFDEDDREARAEEIRKHVFEGEALPDNFSAENLIKINEFKTLVDAKNAEAKTLQNNKYKEMIDDYLYFGNGSNNNNNRSSHTSNESLGPNWNGNNNTNNNMNMRMHLPPGFIGRRRKTRKMRKTRKTKGGKRRKAHRYSRRG